MKQIVVIMAACLLLGCKSNSDEPYLLQGAWTLRQVEYPYDRPDTYYKQENTLLRLYDGDSVVYQCWLTETESGLIIKPELQCPVTLIDKGRGEYIYLEDSDPRPLTVANDSMIVIQQQGILYTFHRANDIAEDWGEDIKAIITDNVQRGYATGAPSYVLSAKERWQGYVIVGFIFASVVAVILMLLIVRIAIQNRRAKRSLQLQLQQIQEVQQERPQAVRQAIETVETSFFASDDYKVLQRRIATGQRLKDEDWQEIESQMKKVYPGFTSQLRGLFAMSELEYEVCLLIKLRIAPSDMAAVLARDVSTISTVRSRLYKKVFGQKGGAREWDDFVLSIGA
jgi:uncharacterized membrane-anchored protein YhcB (DUF1043 family)